MNPNNEITVLHSTYLWLSHTQTWLYNQIRYLPPAIQNHIVCTAVDNLEQFWLPNIHSLSDTPLWRSFSDRAIRKLGLWLTLSFLFQHARRSNAQILHSHFGTLAWVDSPVARQAGLKHVVTFYGRDMSLTPREDPRWYKRYRTLFSNVRCVLCEGPHMRHRVIELGCPADKVHVHHLGIPVDEISFRPRVWQCSKPLRILVAASFREKKGIPYALEALGRLKPDFEFNVTIIGDADSSSRSQAEKKKILDVIEKYQLGSRVRMLGYQPYSVLLQEAYEHHLFLAPSVTAEDGDTEGGAPVTIIEMIASGMPVISTTHCDIPEVIQHERTGLLAAERDVDGLVQMLQRLTQHPARWDEMVRLGRQRVETDFNAVVQGKRLAQLYEMVLDCS